ncbi:hypothetical protein HYV71_03115 [Candidatus Uhrbacteria bacterium]|nr:hypothetical protein [Candidatus Uhrbacteria bacterium]
MQKNDSIDIVVGQESVYERTTPTTKLDPNVLRDEEVNVDEGFYALN